MLIFLLSFTNIFFNVFFALFLTKLYSVGYLFVIISYISILLIVFLFIFKFIILRINNSLLGDPLIVFNSSVFFVIFFCSILLGLNLILKVFMCAPIFLSFSFFVLGGVAFQLVTIPFVINLKRRYKHIHLIMLFIQLSALLILIYLLDLALGKSGIALAVFLSYLFSSILLFTLFISHNKIAISTYFISYFHTIIPNMFGLFRLISKKATSRYQSSSTNQICINKFLKKIELEGEIVKKWSLGSTERLIIEHQKTSAAFNLAQKTNLFYVPKVYSIDLINKFYTMERLKDVINLQEMVLLNCVDKKGLAEQLGIILSVIHNELKLDDTYIIELPEPLDFCSGCDEVFLHGDFGHSNILYRSITEIKIPVIIDWDCTDIFERPATKGPWVFDIVSSVVSFLNAPYNNGYFEDAFLVYFFKSYLDHSKRHIDLNNLKNYFNNYVQLMLRNFILTYNFTRFEAYLHEIRINRRLDCFFDTLIKLKIIQ